jgi:hypothetical protein
MSDGKPKVNCDVKNPLHEPFFNALQRFQADFLPDDIVGAYNSVEELIKPNMNPGVILKNKKSFNRHYTLFRDLATFYSLQVPGDLLEEYLNCDDENTGIIHSRTKTSLGIDLTDTTIIDDFYDTYVVDTHADPYVFLEKILVMLYIKDSLHLRTF